MAYEFSKKQQYVISLLNNIGCCSVYQLCSIMHRVFNAPKEQTKLIIRSLIQVGRLNTDKDFRWVVNGKGKDQEKVNMETILAVGVAINSIHNADDLITMYRPYTGESLSYIADGTSYRMLIADASATAKILDLERKYVDGMAKAKKLNLVTLDVTPHTLLVFSANQNIKSVFTTMNSLELTMPHTIVCVKSDDLAGSIHFDTFNINNDN